MSKGNTINCRWCKAPFIKKREKHYSCSTRCRNKYNRQKNGEPLLPEFISGKKSAPTLSRSAAPVYYLPDSNNKISYALLSALAAGIAFKKSSLALVAGLFGWYYGNEKDKEQQIFIDAKNHQIKNSLLKKSTQRVLPIPTMKKSNSSLVSAEDYRKEYIPEIRFNDRYRYLMGNPSPNFYALITGEPGNGKSTFCIDFANYFHKEHGKTLFLASEQRGQNKSLRDLLRRFQAKFDIHREPNKLNTKQLIDLIKGYKLVVIDSANNMDLHADQLENLRESTPDTAYLVVLQSTKDGNFKGDQALKHNCDVFMKAKEMVCYQEKSRFGTPPSHVHILDK